MKNKQAKLKADNKLTLKQQLFCDYYLEGYGNATEAVIKAGYNVSKKDGTPDRILAKSIASENLTKPYIYGYIQKKLEGFGFNDTTIMKQHLFLINQFADLSVKTKAIDMYYKKTGAYATDKEDQETKIRLDAFLDRVSGMLGK
ncbi:terminase small subunit [Candidatus Parcubacteria bacterium]|nr:terminase small subunit [Candidatus Parcubacteria bacterium]